MINDMIVIYSMQSAEEELMVVSADINELVEFTCRDYDKLFFTKNISLHEAILKMLWQKLIKDFHSGSK